MCSFVSGGRGDPICQLCDGAPHTELCALLTFFIFEMLLLKLSAARQISETLSAYFSLFTPTVVTPLIYSYSSHSFNLLLQ